MSRGRLAAAGLLVAGAGGIVAPTVAPYQPPKAPPASPASSQVREHSESFTQAFFYPEESELLVFSSTKEWSACDVFLLQPNLQSVLTVFTVRIYAVVAGVRVLVASGRLGNIPTSALNQRPIRPEWVAAARIRAERYDVTLFASAGASLLGGAEQIQVAVIAHDDPLAPVPEFLGALPLGQDAAGTRGSVARPTLDSGTGLWPDAELLMVEGVADEAQANGLFLQVFDTVAAAAVAGAPTFVFPLQPTGATGSQGQRFKFTYRTRSGRLQIVASTNAQTYVAANNVMLQALVR